MTLCHLQLQHSTVVHKAPRLSMCNVPRSLVLAVSSLDFVADCSQAASNDFTSQELSVVARLVDTMSPGGLVLSYLGTPGCCWWQQKQACLGPDTCMQRCCNPARQHASPTRARPCFTDQCVSSIAHAPPHRTCEPVSASLMRCTIAWHNVLAADR